MMHKTLQPICNAALLLCWLIVMTACTDDGALLPKSGGKPYEVVVTGNTEEAVRAVSTLLGALTVAGLPQREPTFDISQTTQGIGQATKYARSIINVNIDPEMTGKTRMSHRLDVYAKPQIVINICSPSARQLTTDIRSRQDDIKGIIDRFELEAGITRLSRHRNIKAEKAVKKMFGDVQIWIPEELTAMKKGHDFIWLSDNGKSAMRNICIYTYAYDNVTLPEGAARKRDSVMRKNIPGETAQMFMTTVHSPAPTARTTQHNGRRTMELRGQWVMKGDIMGGPFISRCLIDSTKQRITVAEAFVYAPGTAKRNIIKQLEAVLYTFK